jgi:serine/threonine-protein kinase
MSTPRLSNAVTLDLFEGETLRLDDEGMSDPPSSVDAAPQSQAPLPEAGDRYELLGVIGRGGMGEVQRVRDRVLGRVLVRKVIHAELAGEVPLERFLAEARVTAALEHPGIVPVHDLVRTADGRPAFTMKEVEGRTLSALITERGPRPTGEPPPQDLIAIVLKVAEAVAYAHSRSVVHRDIKPDNIMVGRFGEVLLLDWGLGRWRERDRARFVGAAVEGRLTQVGAVMGTPAYMPPEQAAGDIDLIGPPSDVYGLGAVLFHVLLGRAPWSGFATLRVLGALRCGEVPRIEDPQLPVALVELVHKAMAAEPSERFADGAAFAAALQAWLSGAQRRQIALGEVAAAARLREEAEGLRSRARAQQAVAEAARAALPAHAPDADRRPVWAQEEAAQDLAEAVVRLEVEIFSHLQRALTHEPDLPEAHAGLADLHQARHAEALVRQDRIEAARHLTLLRQHDRGAHRAWIEGLGRLTVFTEPPAAEVELERLGLVDRRLEGVERRALGPGPVVDLRLPAGSWRLRLRAPGRTEVCLPVELTRGGDWTQTINNPVWLPPLGALGPDDVYVPAGPAWVGGGEARYAIPRQRVWIDGFVIRRHPVTNAEYIAFLDDLVAQGREAEALAWEPRLRVQKDAEARPQYGRDEQGRYRLIPDAEGDLWQPDWPVVMVTWEAARGYAAWEAARSGRPWRLPAELEREKAGRGVDGQPYPWGAHLEHTWAALQTARPGRPKPWAVGTPPQDRSVYGVAGLAGNVREWCLDRFAVRGEGLIVEGRAVLPDLDDVGGPEVWRAQRGGTWSGATLDCRQTYRRSAPTSYAGPLIGFRLCRSLGPPTPLR